MFTCFNFKGFCKYFNTLGITGYLAPIVFPSLLINRHLQPINVITQNNNPLVYISHQTINWLYVNNFTHSNQFTSAFVLLLAPFASRTIIRLFKYGQLYFSRIDMAIFSL